MTMLCEMHRKKVEKLLTICNLPTEFLLGKNPVFRSCARVQDSITPNINNFSKNMALGYG